MAGISRRLRHSLQHRRHRGKVLWLLLSFTPLSLILWLIHSVNIPESRSLLSLLQLPPPPPTTTTTTVVPSKHKLRFDWTKLEATIPFTRLIQKHQNNCSIPLADFRFRNRFGLGSDLHVWSQALCNAMEEGYRIRTELPWIFLAKQCTEKNSAMACYFPQAELQCPGDVSTPVGESNSIKLYKAQGKVARHCQSLLKQYDMTYSDVRTAGVEFLFSHVSRLVQYEAERQLNQVFSTVETIPKNLITVHVRWGDKVNEMTLVPIKTYIESVEEILRKRKGSEQSVNIFLATEDPAAVNAFVKQAPRDWSIFVDQYFHDLLPYRNAEYNGNPKMAQHLDGEPGLKALGSLLVAMEANDFVLTTQSNWSRLMNELRKSILDQRCRGCTSMIDLSPGEW